MSDFQYCLIPTIEVPSARVLQPLQDQGPGATESVRTDQAQGVKFSAQGPREVQNLAILAYAEMR